MSDSRNSTSNTNFNSFYPYGLSTFESGSPSFLPNAGLPRSHVDLILGLSDSEISVLLLPISNKSQCLESQINVTDSEKTQSIYIKAQDIIQTLNAHGRHVASTASDYETISLVELNENLPRNEIFADPNPMLSYQSEVESTKKIFPCKPVVMVVFVLVTLVLLISLCIILFVLFGKQHDFGTVSNVTSTSTSRKRYSTTTTTIVQPTHEGSNQSTTFTTTSTSTSTLTSTKTDNTPTKKTSRMPTKAPQTTTTIVTVTLTSSTTTTIAPKASKIVVIGGIGMAESTMEFYNTTSPQSNPVLSVMTHRPRYGHTSALTDDGAVLTIGGFLFANETELFYPITYKVKPGNPTNRPRCYSASATLNRAIYACGGLRTARLSCEKYENGEWTLIAKMLFARQEFAMASLDGYIYAIGGWGYRGRINNVERYDPVRRNITHRNHNTISWLTKISWTPLHIIFNQALTITAVILCLHHIQYSTYEL